MKKFSLLAIYLTRSVVVFTFIVIAATEALGQPQCVGYDLYTGWVVSGKNITKEHYLLSGDATKADCEYIDYLRTLDVPKFEYYDAEYYREWSPDFSSDIDSLNKFFFSEKYLLYSDVVNGYKISLRESPKETMLCFENVENSAKIIYRLKGHLTMNLCVRPNDVGRDYHLFKVDYKEYSSQEIADNGGKCIYPNSLFQFVDIDFDGNDELLIAELKPYREGLRYKAYKIVDDKLVALDYPPFNDILDNWFQIYPASKSIVKFASCGAYLSSKLYYHKHNTKVINRAFVHDTTLLADMPHHNELEEYLMLDSILFTLDSIHYSHPSNSTRKDTVSIFRFEH